VLCNPVEGGLLEVPELCPGSHDFSLVHGFVLLVGHSLERLVLRGGGGSRVCSLFCLVLYPKRAHFASLTLLANYWGAQTVGTLDQGTNHNLKSIALN
jgi:hypothetical protein